MLAIAAARAGSLDAVGWKPLAIVLLSVLPVDHDLTERAAG